MKIIADKREKNSLVIAELNEEGVSVEMKQLQVADYLISKDIAIERKTVNDFISSMLSKRLLKQLIDLKENYSKPLLIIEGIEEQDIYKSDRHPKLHPNAIRGMILSILLEFSIPIILTKDYIDTAQFLILLAKKQEKPSREISLKAKRRAFSLAEQQQFVIESLPGIGPTLAKELLKKFKTVRGVMNANKVELQKVKKINKKKADNIKRLLEAKYKLG